MQRVLRGHRTIGEFIRGKGVLTVQSGDQFKIYDFRVDNANSTVTVEIGQIMQWEAGEDADLEFYEVCDPSYVDGRFKVLAE